MLFPQTRVPAKGVGVVVPLSGVRPTGPFPGARAAPMMGRRGRVCRFSTPLGKVGEGRRGAMVEGNDNDKAPPLLLNASNK